MSEQKRLHVVISDKDSIDWLNKQDNMSASLRLLIQQIARDGSPEDYVQFCARQAPSPFKQGQDDALEEPLNKNETNKTHTIEETEHTATDDQASEDDIVLSEASIETGEAAPIESDVNDDEAIADETDIDDNGPQNGKLTDEEWEEIEEKNDDTINRMLSDLGR